MKRLAVVLVLAGFALPAHALVCTTPPPTCPLGDSTCSPGPPICKATPGVLVCSGASSRACLVDADCVGVGTCVSGVLAIGGTVSPNSNPISTVTLSGATNLTLVPGSPGSPTYFRVFPTNPALDAIGVVVGTDSAAQTCTVPVSFKIRAAGAIVPGSPETVCPLAENYSLDVTSAPNSLAGTTACSSHLARCDAAPPGRPALYEFASDARLLSIRSPITGASVQMEMVRGGGAFCDYLKMLFSRSSNGGSTFSNFADVTTSTVPGSTKIRGTGQWSDVKVVAGVPPCTPDTPVVPTLGEWGIVILSLLLLASSTVLFAKRSAALAGYGASTGFGAEMLDRGLLLRVAGAAGVLWLLGVLTLTALQGAPSTTDMIGSLITTMILAYQVQLWILQARR